MKFLLTIQSFDGSVNLWSDNESSARLVARVLMENEISIFAVTIHALTKKGLLGELILDLKR